MTEQVSEVTKEATKGLFAWLQGTSEPVQITFIIACVVFVILLFKLFSSLTIDVDEKGKKHLRFANKKNKKSQKEESDNVEQLTTLQSLKIVVSEATNLGYNKTELRYNLYNDQVKTLQNNLHLLRTSIVNEFSKKFDKSPAIELARAILLCIFEKSIVRDFQQIFAADRLTDGTVDDLIEKNRPLLESFYQITRQDVVRMVPDEDLRNALIAAVDHFESDFKKTASEVLTSAWELARNYLVAIEALNAKSNKAIDEALFNIIKGNADSGESTEKITWISESDIMPRSTISGVN